MHTSTIRRESLMSGNTSELKTTTHKEVTEVRLYQGYTKARKHTKICSNLSRAIKKFKTHTPDIKKPSVPNLTTFTESQQNKMT